MNLNISYNWLREYLSTAHKPADLARLLSLSGPSIERIHHFGPEWDKVVVGKILEIKPLPSADKLKIAVTSIGSKKMEIVCGGVNLKEGMLVAVALSGSRVRWHGEGDLIELKPTEIRGVQSEAMIAAANEIGLFELFPHKDREVMDLSEVPGAKPGTPLAEALDLEDYIFDTEVTTNRPDLLAMTHFAREASAITREKLDEKKILSLEKYPKPGISEKISVKIEDKKLCPRYTASVVRGVKIAPAPLWMRLRLVRAGISSICNVVDITNYVMLEMGAPMHVFDLAKLNGGIVVRRAGSGEKIKALDGNEYKLNPETLVIADSRRAAAIAGIMGGAETGVSAGTTDIVFEAASFDQVSVRRSSRALNLRSESSLRFEKGLSEDLPQRAIARALELTLSLAGGECGPVSDSRSIAYKPLKYSITASEVQKLIGAPIASGEMKRILTSLGFKIQGTAAKLVATVPYFRDHDIEGGRDLVEEIARVYGYHRLPSRLPEGEIPLNALSLDMLWEDKIKELARGAGLNEVITYSFISAAAMEKMGFDQGRALKLWNPLTSDYEYMRTSLVPSLLEVVAKNQENFPEVRIFETANVYFPRKNELPKEELNLAAAISGKSSVSPFFEAKGIFELFNSRFGLNLELRRDASNAGYWHPGRSAVVMLGGKPAGTLGEVHPAILRKFGIEHRVAILNLVLPEVLAQMKNFGEFKPVPAFPAAKRDISFTVGEREIYEKVLTVVKGASKLIAKAELFDIYSGKGVPEGKKSMAFHITYQSLERTLSSDEVEAAHKALGDILKKELGAEVRQG